MQRRAGQNRPGHKEEITGAGRPGENGETAERRESRSQNA